MAPLQLARHPLRVEVPRGALAVAAVVVCAWLALLVWGASPAARYLGHEGGAGVGAAFLFLAGWVLMILAMMLPTAASLLGSFGRVVRARPDARRLQAAVIAGFVATWLVAGAAFQLADGGIHAAVAAQDWLAANTQLLAAGAFAAAGAYQFTPLKRRCLTACRSPSGFVVRHWRGGRPELDAMRVGTAYGASCVGCCWALMLLLFAVGMANVAWMLAVAAVMATEKLAGGGQRLSRPLGAGLLAAAVVVAVASP